MHLRPHNRPLTFLFAGPSGVGKSEVSKLIASEYIGEKPIILNMSAFDEGVMVTNLGKEIDFSKTIIIATTNACCTEKTGSIGFGNADESKSLSISDLSEYFDTELINRFSHIYTFHSITKPVYARIIKECMRKEVNSLNLDRVANGVAKRIKSMI
nr:AAA family ATPase [Lachnospiraceae bacterium]